MKLFHTQIKLYSLTNIILISALCIKCNDHQYSDHYVYVYTPIGISNKISSEKIECGYM